MHPCHFPTVCPKRLSAGHKSGGSKVSWPLPECTIIGKRRYTSSCRNPTGAAKRFQKVGGWLIRSSSPLRPARAGDFLQEELWPSRAAAIIVFPLSPSPPSATPYKCPLSARSRVIIRLGWGCLRPAARLLTHEHPERGPASARRDSDIPDLLHKSNRNKWLFISPLLPLKWRLLIGPYSFSSLAQANILLLICYMLIISAPFNDFWLKGGSAVAKRVVKEAPRSQDDKKGFPCAAA